MHFLITTDPVDTDTELAMECESEPLTMVTDGETITVYLSNSPTETTE